MSPVYKHLKGIFAYRRDKKGTQLRKTGIAYPAFFQDKPV